MNLPHYTDRCYESARQRRRYHTDPAYRLDRINRARKRFGLAPHRSLLCSNMRFTFERCVVDAMRLRRARIVAGLPLAEVKRRTRKNCTRLALLRKVA